MASKTAGEIRKHIAHIDGAWVRVFRDGQIWAGSSRHSAASMGEVRAALEAAGYRCECSGKSGASGQYIVDVKLPAA